MQLFLIKLTKYINNIHVQVYGSNFAGREKQKALLDILFIGLNCIVQ